MAKSKKVTKKPKKATKAASVGKKRAGATKVASKVKFNSKSKEKKSKIAKTAKTKVAQAPAETKVAKTAVKKAGKLTVKTANIAENSKPSAKDLSPAAILNTPIVEPEVVLTDAEGRRYCRSSECDQISTVDGYCRYHYLLFWKKIQVRKKILCDGKLERYIEELTARYTDKFLELLRKDLRSEKDFLAAVQELELDGSADAPDEDEAKSYIEEFGGVSGSENVRDDDY